MFVKPEASESRWAQAVGRAANGRLVAGVDCLQLARLGGHELAPADYRERGKAITPPAVSGPSLGRRCTRPGRPAPGDCLRGKVLVRSLRS